MERDSITFTTDNLKINNLLLILLKSLLSGKEND